MTNQLNKPDSNQTKVRVLEANERALIDEMIRSSNKKYARFIMAALGSIPWVGGVLGAMAAMSAENDQGKITEIQKLWLQEHQDKISDLAATITDILTRLDSFGGQISERIESPEYLALIRRTFLSWDQADTQDKRDKLKKLITNAGAITLCPDDLVRLFINWIDQYHEAHFAVIKEIYKNPGITRGQIWNIIHPGERPPENSAEADLFRYLIRDLNLGGVIRLERQTNFKGEFYKKSTKGQHKSSSNDIMESAFEDSKPYELTELGKQFVHYVMEDVVKQIRN